MVKLDFRGFDDGAKGAGAAIRGTPLQLDIARLDFAAEQLGGPFRFLKILEGGVDVVWLIALGLA